MMMDLISSAKDICIVFGICDHLGKINKDDLESRQNTTSVFLTPRIPETVNLSRPYAAENFSSYVCTAEESVPARTLSFETAWHADSERLTAEGLLAISESTNNNGSCRKSEGKDRQSTCSTVKLQILQTRPARRAMDCSAYLAEKLADHPVLKVDCFFEESVLEAKLGRSGARTRVLGPASSTSDWWSSVQAASSQCRRMDGQEADFRRKKKGPTWPHEAELHAGAKGYESEESDTILGVLWQG